MPRHDVCITGACLVSSLADSVEEHWRVLQQTPAASVTKAGATSFLVHPLPEIDFSSQITNPIELKRMSRTHALGVYAAGRALESAALKGKTDVLSRAVVVVAGGAGERDPALDKGIFADLDRLSNPAVLNQELSIRTRPSLFLAQLPNLLAGNICVHFGITGASRTTLGEELGGMNAVSIASSLIADGAYDIALVGGALNAERWDLLLLYGSGQFLWRDEYQPVTARAARGGGCILGSMAAFLVLEAGAHALSRGVTPWCRLAGMAARHTERHKRDIGNALGDIWRQLCLQALAPHAVISGASGVAPWTAQEGEALALLSAPGARLRYPGSLFGHSMEASFLFNIGLGALALQHRCMYRPQIGDPPDQRESTDMDHVLVTGIGHFGGEAAALLSHA